MELRRNQNAGKWKLPDGYKDLGWQKHIGNSEEIKSCYDKGHHGIEKKSRIKEFDNSLYQNRCTDVVTFCDDCKIAWHIDMSD